MNSAEAQRKPLRQLGVAVFMAGWMGWQLLLPAWRLVQPERPARFGWHMYSAVAVQPRFVVEMSDGAADTVRVSDVSSRWRPEIDAAAVLPGWLCGSRDGAEAVRVLRSGGAGDQVHACR